MNPFILHAYQENQSNRIPNDGRSWGTSRLNAAEISSLHSSPWLPASSLGLRYIPGCTTISRDVPTPIKIRTRASLCHLH
ncbi:hypothetical protein B0O99DRAFT_605400 [Bisporella sp. PMI_857]|nr:hypothetical protein B0O99DRAFT_605400 [Bisporella sp. PMI_857]